MKIEEQVLSRKQMAHLVELGVDTSDASMYWSYENSCGDRYWVLLPYDKDYGYDKETIPTYTIGDLIEKLPRYLKPGSKDFERSIRIGADYTKVKYQSVWGEKSPMELMEDINETPTLQVLYKLLCWVAKKHKELIK